MSDMSKNPSAGTLRGMRVLFVDDESSLREFMRTELPRMGHEVTVCQDGRAAVKVMEKNVFDAAISTCACPACRASRYWNTSRRSAPKRRPS